MSVICKKIRGVVVIQRDSRTLFTGTGSVGIFSRRNQIAGSHGLTDIATIVIHSNSLQRRSACGKLDGGSIFLSGIN